MEASWPVEAQGVRDLEQEYRLYVYVESGSVVGRDRDCDTIDRRAQWWPPHLSLYLANLVVVVVVVSKSSVMSARAVVAAAARGLGCLLWSTTATAAATTTYQCTQSSDNNKILNFKCILFPLAAVIYSL